MNIITIPAMLYGQRLAMAITHREQVIGRVISRVELAKVAGCTRQNIGMFLGNAKQMDLRLSTESHAPAIAKQYAKHTIASGYRNGGALRHDPDRRQDQPRQSLQCGHHGHHGSAASLARHNSAKAAVANTSLNTPSGAGSI